MVRFVSASFTSAALLLATAPSLVAGKNWGNNHHDDCKTIGELFSQSVNETPMEGTKDPSIHPFFLPPINRC